jgi:class 3 adenylate cyclase/predicted ATPase
VRCGKCGSENRDAAKFCNECAAPLAEKCARCAAINKPGAKFCDECGEPLTAAAPKPEVQPDSTPSVRVLPEVAIPNAADGERKTVTALFADIKGSTELMEELDPEEARAIIDPALKIMVDAVRRYEGYVVQSTGDGIFALFGAPVAREEHPQRALYAALQIQHELRQHGQRATQGRPALEARIGVNTGEVVVRTVETGGKVEYTPIGHTANLASRLQTVAPAGSVAVSDQTSKLVEGYFELRALGPTEVKGVSGAIDVYEVTGLGPLRSHFQLSARRGLTRFVGRERELAEMKRTLELTRGGHGQLIAVVAEAGTGKSRLFYEFKAALPAEYKTLEAYSVSHGKASAWLPVVELLRAYFGIQDVDDAAMRREKIGTGLAALDPALNDAVPYLFVLLGIQDGPDPLAQMDPQVKRRRTLDAIKRIIIRESLNQPTVVIFEDLHWIDRETQALLDLLADSLANSRALLLVNYRPEYRHEWTKKSYYSQFRLDALDGESAGEMVSALLGDGVDLAPLKRLAIERTEGNPFFIEEMVQALFDEGALVRNGTVKVVRSLSQVRVPPTVQGILASRIDRLPAEQKELLQTLAVMGREFPLGLVQRVTLKPGDELEQMLSRLQVSEFIYEQPASRDVEYVFKHALTQEVAYNSLLIERRKQIHERAGQALESMFAGQLNDHLGELAHHYSHSHNIGKAVEYLGRAGQQAMQRSAYVDAIGSLDAALNLVQKLPDSPERMRRELVLRLAIGPALWAVEGYAAPEAERAYARARELCKRLGDPPELFPVLWGLWTVHLMRIELRAAYKVAEELLQLAQSKPDPVLLMRAHYALGTTSYQMGDLLPAREQLEMAIPLYNRDQPLAFRVGVDAGVLCLSVAANTLWSLGYPDQALKRGNEALALAQVLSHPFSLVFAEQFVGGLHQLRREGRTAQEYAEQVLALSAEHGFSLWTAFGTGLRGVAKAEQGRNQEGIALIQEGLAAVRATGSEMGRAYNLNRLAKASIETGRFDDGLSALAKALAAIQHEDRVYEAETHQLKGELLLRQDDSNTAEAQNCFERAIEIARRQSAKSLELRATMSLARLLASQSRRDEARTMLAEIYNWFTEGFDTADLKDAKALLEELAA